MDSVSIWRHLRMIQATRVGCPPSLPSGPLKKLELATDFTVVSGGHR